MEATIPKPPNIGRRAKGPAPYPKDLKRDEILALRCRIAFREWFDELGASLGLTGTETIEHALRELAKRRGFRPAPER